MSNSFDALYNATPFASRSNTDVDNKTADIGPEVILFKAAGLTRGTVTTIQRIAGLSVVMEIQKLEEAFKDIQLDDESSEAFGNILKNMLLGIVAVGEKPTTSSILKMLNVELLKIEPAVVSVLINAFGGTDNIKGTIIDLFSEIKGHLDLIFTHTPSSTVGNSNPLELEDEVSELAIVKKELSDLKSTVKKLQLAAKRS